MSSFTCWVVGSHPIYTVAMDSDSMAGCVCSIGRLYLQYSCTAADPNPRPIYA